MKGRFLSKPIFVVVTFASVAGSAFNTDGGEPSPRDRMKIDAAVPDQASVQPMVNRNLLVFSRAWGYRHRSIPHGKYLAKTLGERTDAFQATLTEDADYFEWDRLSDFDGVLLNNTNNEIFLPEHYAEMSPIDQETARIRDTRLKRNLVRFIKEGRGLAVIHAGVASFREWPEFGVIMGARFDNHPWNAGSTVPLKIEDPSHALCAAFPSAQCFVTDEIYQFKDFDRSLLRVLYRLDVARMNLEGNRGIHRSDHDFALGWVKRYGKGRVFYSAFGHQPEVFWNDVLVRHFLDGIQFVLGDLEAPASSIE